MSYRPFFLYGDAATPPDEDPPELDEDEIEEREKEDAAYDRAVDQAIDEVKAGERSRFSRFPRRR